MKNRWTPTDCSIWINNYKTYLLLHLLLSLLSSEVFDTEMSNFDTVP